jgi:predicted nucleotidyltransferase component of viral defense system
MILSKERLVKEQKATGYRQEMIEKVVWLISILNSIADDSFLKTKFVLKGGTALNLFHLSLNSCTDFS